MTWNIVDTESNTLALIPANGYAVKAQINTGVPPLANITTPYANLDGGIHQRRRFPPRIFTLKVDIFGTSWNNLQTRRDTLENYLDLHSDEEIYVVYQDDTTNRSIEIPCRFIGGLEGQERQGFVEEVLLQFEAAKVWWQDQADTVVNLNTEGQLIIDYNALRDSGGWSSRDVDGAVNDVAATTDYRYLFGAFTEKVLRRNTLGTWTQLGVTQPIGSVSAGLAISDMEVYAGADYLNVYNGLDDAWRKRGWLFTVAQPPNGTVRAIAFHPITGDTYIGGDFTAVGSVSSVNRVAYWDGSVWNALGSGVNNSVYALAFDSVGNLYLGGYFTGAGGVTGADRIAMWDGNNYNLVGEASDLNSAVEAIAIKSDTEVYIGGMFSNAGRKGICKYDGVSISAVGTNTDNDVYSLAIHPDGNIWAGGSFSNMGGVAAADRLAVWDGSVWNALGSGVNNVVYALAFDSVGNLYLGGHFTGAGGVAGADLIAMWDGNNYNLVGEASDLNNAVEAIAIKSDTEVYIGGMFSNAGRRGICKYDGVSISAVGTNTDNHVYSLAIQPNGDVWAGGPFSNMGGVAAADQLAVWDGSVWNPLQTVSGGPFAFTAIGKNSGNLYVASDSGLYEWNISTNTWTDLNGGNSINDFVILDNRYLFAVGSFTTIGSGGAVSAKRIAQLDLDTATWTALGTSPNDGAEGEIYAIDTDGKDIWIVGNFAKVGGSSGTTVNGVAKYDVSAGTWTALSTGINTAAETLRDVVVVSANEVYVAGKFSDIAGADVSIPVAMWDGAAWNQVHSDLIVPDTGEITSMAFESNRYVYGFSNQPVATLSSVTLDYTGTAESSPAIEFAGVGTLHYIRNDTTGAQIKFASPGLTLVAGDVVQIVTEKDKTSVLKVNGTNKTSLFPSLDGATQLASFVLLPGPNLISFFLAGSGDLPEVTVTYRNKYRSSAAASKQ